MKSERELLRENLERFRTKNPHRTEDPVKRSLKFRRLNEDSKEDYKRRQRRQAAGNWNKSVGQYVMQHSEEIEQATKDNSLPNYVRNIMMPALGDEAKTYLEGILQEPRNRNSEILQQRLWYIALAGDGLGTKGIYYSSSKYQKENKEALNEESELQQSSAAPYFFEMKWTGDDRGYFFKGSSSWEDNDLLRGLATVKTLGDKEWLEDEYADEDFSSMGVKGVIDWLESDVIGTGEEAYAEIKVNGVTIFKDPLGVWMYDNLEDDEEYEQKVEQKFGANVWLNNWSTWFPEKLNGRLNESRRRRLNENADPVSGRTKRSPKFRKLNEERMDFTGEDYDKGFKDVIKKVKNWWRECYEEFWFDDYFVALITSNVDDMTVGTGKTIAKLVGEDYAAVAFCYDSGLESDDDWEYPLLFSGYILIGTDPEQFAFGPDDTLYNEDLEDMFPEFTQHLEELKEKALNDPDSDLVKAEW